MLRPPLQPSDQVLRAAQAGGIVVPGPGTMRIVAVYGIYVDDAVGTDRYLLETATLAVIRREIGRKRRAYRWSEAADGVVLEDVPPADQDRSVLGIEQMQRLGRLVLDAEAGDGALRWAISSGLPHITRSA